MKTAQTFTNEARWHQRVIRRTEAVRRRACSKCFLMF